ncbi:TlpA disulfide reductase family protein [Actinokineospora sp. NBRC 105648]|uniref:TlpA disulfide reductase family protein n=1 Tax=Actinokineospora sp. NBRC 105648 TaxID=3032206 RepID=UPI0024A5F568|nr:TlpA disulfide reductase family protein [Actinokineospora sp. NBRC 105648]GLZ41811.1 hypothetical protein Acsp05_54350 [Actinokineospora sp. NBRC 105648]
MRARLIGVCLALALAACSSSGAEPVPVNGAEIPVRDRIAIEGLSGESLLEPGATVSLSDFAGQVVVLNVWGAWCGPCRAETPELIAAHDETADLPVGFLGIDVRDNDRGYAEDFARDRRVPYPSIYDPPARTLLKLGEYRGVTVPGTVVLDRRHRVAAVFLGDLLRTDLVPVVRRVAAET